MRKKCLDCVYELAARDRNVVFIGSDLGAGTLDRFKSDFPDRFFMEGVSEASIVSMAAGLALEGRIVYVNTIATFASMPLSTGCRSPCDLASDMIMMLNKITARCATAMSRP